MSTRPVPAGAAGARLHAVLRAGLEHTPTATQTAPAAAPNNKRLYFMLMARITDIKTDFQKKYLEVHLKELDFVERVTGSLRHTAELFKSDELTDDDAKGLVGMFGEVLVPLWEEYITKIWDDNYDSSDTFKFAFREHFQDAMKQLLDETMLNKSFSFVGDESVFSGGGTARGEYGYFASNGDVAEMEQRLY